MKKLCKLIMLPTDYADNAILIFKGMHKFAEYYENQYFTQQYLSSIGAISYFLYILSNDKIEVNDWCYDSKENRILKNQYFPEKVPATRKKVIATNSHSSKFLDLPKLPVSFLQHYAIEYSKHNMIVDIKVEYDYYPKLESETIPEICAVKVNPENNTIIITVPEKVVYTKDEVIKLFKSFNFDLSVVTSNTLHNWLDKHL